MADTKNIESTESIADESFPDDDSFIERVSTMAAFFYGMHSELNDVLLDTDVESLEDMSNICEQITTFFKVATECHKLARDLRDAFNTLVKVAHDGCLLNKEDIDVIYTYEGKGQATGKGRPPMTPAEKVAAAKKRLANRS